MNAAPGTVFEIKLPRGFGYAQLRNTHSVYGDILALDPKIYDVAVSDVSNLALDQVVIFPLQDAIRKNTLTADVFDAPSHAKPIHDMFKFAVRDGQGNALYWWLWDGQAVSIAQGDMDLSKIAERRVLSSDQFTAIWLGEN